MKKSFLLIAPLLLSSLASFAGGFQLKVQGVRQLAMGGTGAAWAWDASTIYFNPGGLSTLSGMQVYGSINTIMPRTEMVNNGTVIDAANKTYPTFNIYAGGPIRKGSKFAIGLGIYTPFGSGISWNDNWVGKYVIQNVQLSTVFIQPTASYKLNDVFSVGAGFIYATGHVQFQQAIPAQDVNGTNGEAYLKGNANGVGMNAGLHMKLGDKIQAGFTFHSKVKMDVRNGSSTFTVPYSLQSNFPSGIFTTSVSLPSSECLGLAFKPTKHLTISLEADFNQWSQYDSLIFHYSPNTAALQDTRLPKKYKNTTSYHIGANYHINHYASVMLGGAYDPTPIQDGFLSPDLPDANRWIVTGGVTVRPVSSLTVMLAVEYVSSLKRTGTYDYANFGGQYQTKVLTPALGVYYNF